MKPIVLEALPRTSDCIGTVRLTPKAEQVIRRLNYQTGIPIRRIVSEIIIQAEGLIEIRAADAADEGDDADADT